MVKIAAPSTKISLCFCGPSPVVFVASLPITFSVSMNHYRLMNYTVLYCAPQCCITVSLSTPGQNTINSREQWGCTQGRAGLIIDLILKSNL